MKFSIITILSLASFVLAGVPARKQSKTPEYIPDSYIIQFKDTITMSAKGDNAHFKWLNEALAKENVKREAGAPKYGVKSKYQIPGFMGYSGTFSKSIVDEIKARNEVSAIQFYIAHYPTPRLITSSRYHSALQAYQGFADMSYSGCRRHAGCNRSNPSPQWTYGWVGKIRSGNSCSAYSAGFSAQSTIPLHRAAAFNS